MSYKKKNTGDSENTLKKDTGLLNIKKSRRIPRSNSPKDSISGRAELPNIMNKIVRRKNGRVAAGEPQGLILCTWDDFCEDLKCNVRFTWSLILESSTNEGPPLSLDQSPVTVVDVFHWKKKKKLDVTVRVINNILEVGIVS